MLGHAMCDSYLLVCVVVAAVGCTRRAALNSTLFGVRAYNELLVPVIPSRLSPVPDLTFDYCVVPVSQSVSSRSSPALTTPPSQRTAPFPSVNTSTVLARSGYSHFASEVGHCVTPSSQGDLWCSLPYTTGRDCDRRNRE